MFTRRHLMLTVELCVCGERGQVDSKGGGQGLAVIKARELPGVSRGVLGKSREKVRRR
jgi:hypothetical protein